ncbi:hypothetical protein DM860_009125 [Cuscuta australis]|uniref:DUF7866 domain-containing protein n=1 Tax=Cuscuta australis TaxID=267555 RepID=A0A328DDF5_9ASTE|nr:hypothetical protein DM860_009125 [Cuscuta australis]
MSPTNPSRVLFFFFLFLLLIPPFITSHETTPFQANASAAELVPLIGKAEAAVELNETRRKLNSFRICALCTCCAAGKGYCLPSPCCYAINCNIPNRPFGFCSFTPKTSMQYMDVWPFSLG